MPNLAIEVSSPSNLGGNLVEKVIDYFKVGVERVWILYPLQQQIYVYTSPTNVTVLTDSDELADEAILPGFRAALGELFDESAA